MLRIFFSRWQNVVDFLVLATAIYWRRDMPPARENSGKSNQRILWRRGVSRAATGANATSAPLPHPAALPSKSSTINLHHLIAAFSFV
jgi:hypothetical protein